MPSSPCANYSQSMIANRYFCFWKGIYLFNMKMFYFLIFCAINLLLYLIEGQIEYYIKLYILKDFVFGDKNCTFSTMWPPWYTNHDKTFQFNMFIRMYIIFTFIAIEENLEYCIKLYILQGLVFFWKELYIFYLYNHRDFLKDISFQNLYQNVYNFLIY